MLKATNRYFPTLTDLQRFADQVARLRRITELDAPRRLDQRPETARYWLDRAKQGLSVLSAPSYPRSIDLRNMRKRPR